MTLTQYIQEKKVSKAKLEECEAKWQKRVPPNGWDKVGEAGASAYIRKHGGNGTITSEKLAALAKVSEKYGASGLALGFWKAAFTKETGSADFGDVPTLVAPPAPDSRFVMQAEGLKIESATSELPAHLTCTNFVPMQPEDAKHDWEFYLSDKTGKDYLAQEKVNGMSITVIASDGGVRYQARPGTSGHGKEHGAPSPEIHAAMLKAYKNFGPFVLTCEKVEVDPSGNEHIAAGDDFPTETRLAVFGCVFLDMNDLTDHGCTEQDRIDAVERVTSFVHDLCPSVYFVDTAYGEVEKRALYRRQHEHGREGVVFKRRWALWHSNKNTSDDIARLKFTKKIRCLVLALPPTDKDRPFKAAEVGVFKDGVLTSIGSVGTGYTLPKMRQIKERFDLLGAGRVALLVETRGYTKYGNLWHAGLLDVCGDDVVPETCQGQEVD